jgi:hypothetical protein
MPKDQGFASLVELAVGFAATRDKLIVRYQDEIKRWKDEVTKLEDNVRGHERVIIWRGDQYKDRERDVTSCTHTQQSLLRWYTGLPRVFWPKHLYRQTAMTSRPWPGYHWRVPASRMSRTRPEVTIYQSVDLVTVLRPKRAISPSRGR